MKIVVFEIEEWEHEACLRLQPEHQLTCTCDRLDENTALQHADAEIISTFVTSTLSGLSRTSSSSRHARQATTTSISPTATAMASP